MNNKLKVGLATDDYKVPDFIKMLDAGGYEYEQRPGLTSNTAFFMVMVEPEKVGQLTADIKKISNRRLN